MVDFFSLTDTCSYDWRETLKTNKMQFSVFIISYKSIFCNTFDYYTNVASMQILTPLSFLWCLPVKETPTRHQL